MMRQILENCEEIYRERKEQKIVEKEEETM